MPIVKRALKREPGYPVGVPAPLYLDCECGHHLSMPHVNGLPIQAYVCLCGREYDPRGWLLKESA